jgi:hypothetical protein
MNSDQIEAWRGYLAGELQTRGVAKREAQQLADRFLRSTAERAAPSQAPVAAARRQQRGPSQRKSSASHVRA